MRRNHIAAKIRMNGSSDPKGLGADSSVEGAMPSMETNFEPKPLDKEKKLIAFVGEKGEKLIDFGCKKASS